MWPKTDFKAKNHLIGIINFHAVHFILFLILDGEELYLHVFMGISWLFFSWNHKKHTERTNKCKNIIVHLHKIVIVVQFSPQDRYDFELVCETVEKHANCANIFIDHFNALPGNYNRNALKVCMIYKVSSIIAVLTCPDHQFNDHA